MKTVPYVFLSLKSEMLVICGNLSGRPDRLTDGNEVDKVPLWLRERMLYG